MLAGRSIQGLGGGVLLALCYSMIQLVFEERLWPRAINASRGKRRTVALDSLRINSTTSTTQVARSARFMRPPACW